MRLENYPEPNACSRLYREHIARTVGAVWVKDGALVCDGVFAWDSLLEKINKDGFYGWSRCRGLSAPEFALRLNDLTILNNGIDDWMRGMDAIGCLAMCTPEMTLKVTDDEVLA